MILTIFLLLRTNAEPRPISSIMFLVDLSHSMNVQDISTDEQEFISRLTLSKMLMHDFIKNNSWSLSMWVVLFAEQALIHVPPTSDHTSLLQSIDSLNTNLLPAQWTNILWAIALAHAVDPWTHLVLLTDGGEEQSLIYTGNDAIPLHIVAIGSDKGGVIRNARWTIYRDQHNQAHVASVNHKYLQQLQTTFDASYQIFASSDDNTTITTGFVSWASMWRQRKLLLSASILLIIIWL